MPGFLIKVQGEARRFGLAVLLVYLGSLALIAFGHTHAVTWTAPPRAHRLAADGPAVERPAAVPAHSHAPCLACSLHRSSTAAGVGPRASAPTLPRSVRASAPASAAPRFGVALLTLTRGPPAS